MISIEFLRQFRLGGYAIFDFAASFLGIWLISPLLSKLFAKIKIQIPKRNWIFLTLPIGILIHIIFGTITPMTKNFLDIHDHYILKIIMLTLLFFGFRGIKMIKK